MEDLIIDTEKLAYGLRRGIGDTDSIFAAMPEDLRLRGTACGLVASAIHQFCQRSDIQSELGISSPNLPFDPKMRMQHVLPFIGERENGLTFIDASYSQFFGYLGLHWAHKDIEAFPEEEIIHFDVSEEQLAVNWLTIEAVRVQKRMRLNRKTSDDKRKLPLIAANREEIHDSFAEIYRMPSYQPWEPPEHVVRHGVLTARQIPTGAIIIS